MADLGTAENVEVAFGGTDFTDFVFFGVGQWATAIDSAVENLGEDANTPGPGGVWVITG
jgi:hypothetical protein